MLFCVCSFTSVILCLSFLICFLGPNFRHITFENYSKTCVKRPLSKRPKFVLETNYRLMQVKSIIECPKRRIFAILLSFIKLPFVTKIFVLFIFECPFYAGFIGPDHWGDRCFTNE